MPPQNLAYFLQHYISDPVPPFLDNNAKLMLSSAIRNRYGDRLPEDIRRVLDPIEAVRQQERLSSIFLGIGPNATATIENCRQVLRTQWPNQLRESDISDVLVGLATSPNPGEWSGRNFMRAVQAEGLHENFDWILVAKAMDHPDLVLKDTEGLALVLEAFSAIEHPPEDFAFSDIWGGRWANIRSQLSVLKAYNTMRPDTERYDMARLNLNRKVLTQDDFADAPATVKALASSLEGQKLNSIPTVGAILHIAFDNDLPQDVLLEGRALLERSAKYTPELLLLGAFQLPRPWSPEHEQTVYNLFTLFFNSHPSFQLVFWKLWKQDKIYLAQRFLDKYHSHPGTIARTYEIAESLHVVNEMLDIGNAQFVLDFAAFAAQREQFDLEKWLREMIGKHGSGFVMECLRFLKLKTDDELPHIREKPVPQPMKASVGAVYTFLQVLDKW